MRRTGRNVSSSISRDTGFWSSMRSAICPSRRSIPTCSFSWSRAAMNAARRSSRRISHYHGGEKCSAIRRSRPRSSIVWFTTRASSRSRAGPIASRTRSRSRRPNPRPSGEESENHARVKNVENIGLNSFHWKNKRNKIDQGLGTEQRRQRTKDQYLHFIPPYSVMS